MYFKKVFVIVAICLIAFGTCLGCKDDSSTLNNYSTSSKNSTPQNTPDRFFWEKIEIEETATVEWLNFSKVEDSLESKPVMIWLSSEFDALKDVMGETYYEPTIFVARYDVDNDDIEDYIVYICNHIGYQGSAGGSLSIMYFDGSSIFLEEDVAHFKINDETLQNEGDTQIGIAPDGKGNHLYVLGNIYERTKYDT